MKDERLQLRLDGITRNLLDELARRQKMNVSESTDPGVKKLASLEIALPGYGLDRQVEVLFYFGKVDIQVSVKNLETGETKSATVRFSSSFG